MERYNNKRIILYFVLLILAVIVVWLISGLIFAYKPLRRANTGFNEAFYYQPRIVFYPIIHTYGTLIDCLAEKESSGNPSAYNPEDIDGRPKYGLLQYDERTFRIYCVDEYGYQNNIWSAEIQRDCCAEMLRDGGISHWPTAKLCD